jgi:molecular chaperone GrpE (heat shock protein)
MDTIEELRSRAAEVLRAASQGRRDSERARQQSDGDLARVALAAVEGLEALTDTLDSLQAELPESARETVRLSARAAWERLEAAGIVLDGRVGEPVDLVRHRVMKTVAKGTPGTVAAVITPGVTFAGTRVRDAMVWAVGEPEAHGTDRD